MNNITAKTIMLEQAWHFLGKPYLWGGDDPVKGFDCSGFIIEILKSVGILPRKGDWTADMLMETFSGFEIDKPEGGALIFYLNQDGKAVHVELLINDRLSIGASGGGSRTKTVKDAIDQNAYIKIRPWKSRKGPYVFIDPLVC